MDNKDLKQQRDALGLSTTQLAARLGVDYMSVSAWIGGRRNPGCGWTLLSMAMKTLERDMEAQAAEAAQFERENDKRGWERDVGGGGETA